VTFLNGAFLFLLSAVSIPLIIHFLSKRRIKTIEFSSLKFLEQMQKSRMRWLRIKELILLALRMLVIALIVMAFARPTLRGFAGSSKATSSVAIILDRSISMDSEGETGTVFEEAKRIAGRLIDSFGSGDKITLIAYPGQGEPEIVGPTNPGEKLKERLGAIELSYQKGIIGPALEKARTVLRQSADLNQEIYLLSDMQDVNFTNLPPEILSAESWGNIHIFAITPPGTGEENIAVNDVLMPAQLMIPGENFEIEAELVNSGKGRLENVLVGVVVDGERKAQTAVSLPPAQPTKASFPLKVDTPGDHGGYIEIDHDNFEPDNKRFFSFVIPEKINLLSVSQTADIASPVRLALDRPEAGQIAYRGIAVSDLLREDLTTHDVILLNDISALDPSRESAIRRFVESGKGLFIVLGRSAEMGYWSKFVREISGIEASPPAGKEGEYLTWDNFDLEHPIFAIYGKNRDDRTAPSIPELKIVHYRDLKGGKALGLTSNGITLMAESSDKPALVFGSGFDLSSNDLAAHSFFVPLLVRSVEYLGSRNVAGGGSGIVGEMLRWRIPANITSGLTLRAPDNSAENLQPIPDVSGSSVNITKYGMSGIYTLMAPVNGTKNEKQVGLISINIDNAESSGDRLSPEDLSDRLGVPVISVSPESDMKATVLQGRLGRELWKEFLLLAMTFLIIESILGRTSPPKTENK
jgi:hypothetical protein